MFVNKSLVVVVSSAFYVFDTVNVSVCFVQFETFPNMVFTLIRKLLP